MSRRECSLRAGGGGWLVRGPGDVCIPASAAEPCSRCALLPQRAQYQDKLARQRYEDQLKQQVSWAHLVRGVPSPPREQLAGQRSGLLYQRSGLGPRDAHAKDARGLQALAALGGFFCVRPDWGPDRDEFMGRMVSKHLRPCGLMAFKCNRKDSVWRAVGSGLGLPCGGATPEQELPNPAPRCAGVPAAVRGRAGVPAGRDSELPASGLGPHSQRGPEPLWW